MVGSLAAYPLRIPPAEIAAFDLVVLLDAWEERGGVRREVTEIAALAPVPGSGGVRVDRLLRQDARGRAGTLEVPVDMPALQRLGLSAASLQWEVMERADTLSGLTSTAVAGGDVRQSLQRLGGRWLPGEPSG